MKISLLIGLSIFFMVAESHVPRLKHTSLHSASTDPLRLRKRADEDPSDFSWVRRWAAIGDSYTAGIGSGRALGKWTDGEHLDIGLKDAKAPLFNITLPNLDISGHDNWYCARYDMSYPMIISRLFGTHVDDFQYAACSGDRAGQIYQQAKQIEGDLDLVMMTAGGNDLCLVCIVVLYRLDDPLANILHFRPVSSRTVSSSQSATKRHAKLSSKSPRRTSKRSSRATPRTSSML